MNIITRTGFFITNAETRVITIERIQTMVVMILFLLNMLFNCFNGPHKKNDLHGLIGSRSLPRKTEDSTERVGDCEPSDVACDQGEQKPEGKNTDDKA